MKFNLIKYFSVLAISTFCTLIQVKAQVSKIELKATGLTCSMCSNAIFKQLKNIPEVEEVKTDLNNNAFIVTLKNGATVSPNDFKAKVEGAGFFVGSFIVATNAAFVQNSNYIILQGNAKQTGEVKFQILDKGFVTEKEYKKLLKQHTKTATYIVNNPNDFHIKILS